MYTWLKEQIKQNYQFIRVIKKKDTGELLLYRHNSLGNYILVKELDGEYPVYELLSTIKHKNLPLVYEACSNGNKTLIVEEYIDGMSLNQVLEQGVYSVYAMKQIVQQLCDAIHVLHTNHIVYRDIKPENILIDSQGTVKLIDFDASKIYKLYEIKDTRIMGTVGYAAPEQFGITQSDEKSDIYSLGILINVMLTGEHPAKLMYKGKIGKIIEKCIMTNPERRFDNVIQIKEKLEK